MSIPLPPASPACPVHETEVRPGRYQHFKGNLYEVLHVAKHCDTQESFVVYRALYGEHGLWIRSLEDFISIVERDGATHTRFRRLDPSDLPAS
jgi:hypothetical protein